MNITRTFVVAAFAALVSLPALADDAFFRAEVSDLKITEGALPQPNNFGPRRWEMYDLLRPYAVLDGPGEVYLARDTSSSAPDWREGAINMMALVARVPAGAPATGWLFAPSADWSGLTPVHFSIPDSAASPEARRHFFASKEAHHLSLQSRGIPGAAWFRRQAIEAHRELPKQPDEPPARGFNRRGGHELTDTYRLFIGGRAVSENLQLNRDLPGAPAESGPNDIPVALSSIEGITVRAMDWKAALGDSKPALDPLAAAIPADQHAVFFPSFDALISMLDHTSEQGLPVFRGVMARSEDAGVVERYQRQLCLPTGPLSRLIGPSVVKSVAITGSDPYFPTGTDVAVLFQAHDAKALSAVILAQVRLNAGAKPDLAEKTETIDGVQCVTLITPERAICAYVAAIGDAVVVTNSPAQVRRLAAVHARSAPALDTLLEFRYFRNRYPVAAEGQTAFVFLSDATIRRWCGPEWRIGASRRLRAAAIMADAEAAHMDDLVAGLRETRSVDSDTPMRTIGKLTLGPGGVRSSIYGSPVFLTPIAELEIKEVATDEAASYKQWRDSYQRNWSWAFDPIGMTFAITPTRISADLTVIPLIIGTEYRTFLDFAHGAAIAPGAGDPHESIAQAVVAVNVESGGVKAATGMARMMAPGVEVDPLGWLGQSVSLYADPDPFWAELLGVPDAGTFMEQNAHRLPVGLYAQVGSTLKLTAFLAAARGFIDQSAPGMLAWETRAHKDQQYVRVALTEKARAEGEGGAFDKLAVFYAATPRALILSLNEELLKRAIDRQTARTAPDAKVAPAQRPWLGSSLCLQFTRAGLELLGGPGDSPLRTAMQQASWSNIPILNEWKRRYPDRDPLQVHHAHWGVRLLDPASGQYQWNERFKTMESTTFGHPGEPKTGPKDLGPLNTIASGNAGLTFENDGLRARAIIEREPAKP